MLVVGGGLVLASTVAFAVAGRQPAPRWWRAAPCSGFGHLLRHDRRAVAGGRLRPHAQPRRGVRRLHLRLLRRAGGRTGGAGAARRRPGAAADRDAVPGRRPRMAAAAADGGRRAAARRRRPGAVRHADRAASATCCGCPGCRPRSWRASSRCRRSTSWPSTCPPSAPSAGWPRPPSGCCSSCARSRRWPRGRCSRRPSRASDAAACSWAARSAPATALVVLALPVPGPGAGARRPGRRRRARRRAAADDVVGDPARAGAAAGDRRVAAADRQPARPGGRARRSSGSAAAGLGAGGVLATTGTLLAGVTVRVRAAGRPHRARRSATRGRPRSPTPATVSRAACAGRGGRA